MTFQCSRPEACFIHAFRLGFELPKIGRPTSRDSFPRVALAEHMDLDTASWQHRQSACWEGGQGVWHPDSSCFWWRVGWGELSIHMMRPTVLAQMPTVVAGNSGTLCQLFKSRRRGKPFNERKNFKLPQNETDMCHHPSRQVEPLEHRGWRPGLEQWAPC